jgi:hypothetical protein
MMGHFKAHWAQATKVALSVGSILLLINQYDALFGESTFRLISAVLTYIVPFCVFMMGKYSAQNPKREQP